MLPVLLLARQRYPGQRNSLDALCKRLGVDNTHRQLHGALLDSQLLAEVYLALTSGQSEIGFGAPAADEDHGAGAAVVAFAADALDPALRPRVRVGEDELAAHAARVEALRKKSGRNLWEPA